MSFSPQQTSTHTYTHTQGFLFLFLSVCICVCLCVCEQARFSLPTLESNVCSLLHIVLFCRCSSIHKLEVFVQTHLLREKKKGKRKAGFFFFVVCVMTQVTTTKLSETPLMCNVFLFTGLMSCDSAEETCVSFFILDVSISFIVVLTSFPSTSRLTPLNTALA